MVSEVVVGGEGGSEDITVIQFAIMETLMVLRVVLHFVPLTAGQISALCRRR